MGISWMSTARKPEPQNQSEDGLLNGVAATMSAANMGYWIYSFEDGALKTSEGLRRIFGKAFPASMASEHLYRWFFSESEDEENDLMRLRAGAWRNALIGSTQFNEEHLVSRIDGSEIWVRTIVSAELGPDQKPVRIFGLSIDIDAQKSREMASAAAGEKIAEESRHKTDFLATMSHEIRTPLNGVFGMAQLLETTDLNDHQRSCVRTIRSSGEAMLSMLNDALDLSKIEKGLIEICPAPLDLSALVDEVLNSARGHAKEKGLALHRQTDPACEGEHIGDASRIRQILANLTFNAVKFTKEGSVKIGIAPSPDLEGALRISIQDTGPGIPEAERARVFERFGQTRAEAAQGGGRGAGLGLAICGELATLMGGRVGLESLVGVGSTFWVDLPLPSADAPPAAEAPEADAKADDGAAWLLPRDADAPPRILIAEDDPTNQKVFLGALEPKGYEIEIANDGLEALEALQRSRFDLVLMDINMPRMSGDEAIVQIRATEAPYQSVPIMVVTALTSRDARKEYCEMGANDYLPKPLDIALLLNKVERMIAAQRS